jgi:amino acid transporter
MYCSSCGTETTPGLKYCKRCGVNLNSSADAPAPKKFPLVLTIAFLALMGFVLSIGMIAPFAIVSETMGRGINVNSIMPLLMLIPCVAFGVVGLLVWLLLHLIKIHQQSGALTQPDQPRQPSIKDYTPAQIAPPSDVMGSVTEHTTRNFESIENKARTRESVRDTH